MTSLSIPARHTLVAAVAAGACAATMAAAGLGSAPTANATCLSVFGIGNGGGCTSNLFSAALAIGNGATATATGLFGGALASIHRCTRPRTGVGIEKVPSELG